MQIEQGTTNPSITYPLGAVAYRELRGGRWVQVWACDGTDYTLTGLVRGISPAPDATAGEIVENGVTVWSWK